jgi:hypothetical protein
LLCIQPQVEAFKALPEGTVHFISGTGRSTMPPIMATGAIDGLAFIGGSNAADDLIKQHPHPHRLKVFLQLEANNMAVRNRALDSIPTPSFECTLMTQPIGCIIYRYTCRTSLQPRTKRFWRMPSPKPSLGHLVTMDNVAQR